MDENKIFDMLEKIYTDVQETKVKVSSIENNVKKLGITIDEKLVPTDNALLDGYKDNAEHIAIIDNKVDKLQMNVNNISMKVAHNDNRIIEISKGIKKAKKI